MAGDTDNIEVWSEADVLIGSITATDPTAGADFTMNAPPTTTTEWDFAGLLDGGAGFAESMTNDSASYSAWGVGEVATSRRNLAVTKTFTVLEDNKVTQGLRWDTTGVTYTTVDGGVGYSGTLKGRDLNEKFKIAFETRSGTVIKRYITKNYAQIESVGDRSEGEDGMESFSVTVKIYPDADGNFWTVYKGAAS